MALGALAVASTAMGVAGCSSDDGGSTVIGSSSIPVITGLSHPAVLTNGQTPAGATVRLEIRGDDFDKNAEVILLAKAPATLSATAANLTSGIAGVTSQQCIRIPAANRTWMSQNRIDILTLPASPLAAANLQGTVIVQVINPGGVVNTDGTPDGSGTADELTYYADTGVQVAVAQSGPLSGAWTNVYPGQSGVEYTATITNMTLEPINSLALTNRSLNFGTVNAHALSYVIQEPATTLAVGASTTARFLVAFSNELPDGSASGACDVTAVGATSGRSYTGTGSATSTTGSTPTINTRGGNLALAGAAAGNGGDIAITSRDGGVVAAEAGVTLGAAVAVPAITDALASTTTETPATIKTTLVGASPVAVAVASPGVLVLNGTIDLPTGNMVWNFTGAFPVVFRGVTIRAGNDAGVIPGSLTINAQNTVQFINCTIDLTDRRVTATAQPSGALIVNGCTAGVGAIDISNSTFRTRGVRGQGAATAAGAQTIQTSGAAAASPITIVNSTFDMSGAGMVQANLALPIAPTGTDTTPGAAFAISTIAGPVRIDGQSLIKTSGGSMIALAGNTADVGAKPAGTVTITVGDSQANQNDLTFNGRIEAKGGDALNTVHTTATNRPNGGAVTITARKVNIGNTAGRPVLLSNGGSNSIVGSLSLVGVTLGAGNTAGTGGNAGTIHFINGALVQEGPFSMAAGSGLIAIGGGGDSGGGTGGAISFGVDQNNEATAAEATAQTVTMAGVVDSSGGWVRGSSTAGNLTAGASGAVVCDGSTSVTLSGVILSQGGSSARSGNPASPVAGRNVGGPATGGVTVRSGLSTVASADVGHLTVSGTIGTRGGFYTLGTGLAAAGGAGGPVVLAGERVTVTTTGKVITNGGGCGDAGVDSAGGRAGALTINSGLENVTLGAGSNGTVPAAGTDVTALTMQGLLQADGGNFGLSQVKSGRFNVSRGSVGTTVTVTWPAHGAANGDLVTVAGSGAGADVTDVVIANVGANDFTYEASSPVGPGSFAANVTLKLLSDANVGGSNSIILRQDNAYRITLAPIARDRVNITGTIQARAGKAAGNPGVIQVFGARNDAGETTDDGGAIDIAQSAILYAAGSGTELTLDSEDVGVVTVAGKLTVDNDRPGGAASVVGNMNVRVRLGTEGTATAAGSIVINGTGELLVSGGHSGTGVLTISNAATGPVTLTPAFIRSEDQTVVSTSTTCGQGGVIAISGAGAVNHTAGEITARGTNSAAGHGGQISFSATGATGTTSLLGLTGTGVARVDGAGSNGWGGRIALAAALANGGGTTAAINVANTYALSANGSGLGGGGLPTAQSARNDGNLANGGIYIGGSVANQIVTVSTTSTISATGGSYTGPRNANGTPASGCLGGVVTFGTAANELGTLTINSGIDVSGGANAAGPGGSGGAITVLCNDSAAAAGALLVASGASTTWSANGGASTYPQSVGGPAGNIVITGAADSTMAFGTAGFQFRASLVGGGGPTVGGDAGVFQITNNAMTGVGSITFLSSTVSVTGGTGSITGANGVVRLIATNAANNIADTFTGTPAVLAVTGLTVEPANGATNNPVQTLFVQD